MNRKKEWEKHIRLWKSYKPPVVPSEREIEIYREFLEGHDEKNALLFGATPQLRDLLYELEYKVTLIDFDKDGIELMQELMKNKNDNETKIVDDWLNINKIKFKEKFDVILGDHFLNNLKLKDFDFILPEIKKLMNPNGLFITNIMVSYDEKADFDKLFSDIDKIKDIKDKFKELYKFSTNTFFNEKEQSIDLSAYDKKIKEFVKKRVISEEEGKKLIVGLCDEEMIMTMPRFDIIKRILSKYFKILEINHNKEHNVFKYYQIFKLI